MAVIGSRPSYDVEKVGTSGFQPDALPVDMPAPSAPDLSTFMQGAPQDDAPASAYDNLPPDLGQRAIDQSQANVQRIQDSLAPYDQRLNSIYNQQDSTLGQLSNLGLAPASVQPIGRSEAQLTGGLAILGALLGARNAGQALGQYNQNRNLEVQQDYTSRRNNYVMAHQQLEDMANQLKAQAQQVSTGRNKIEGDLTKAEQEKAKVLGSVDTMKFNIAKAKAVDDRFNVTNEFRHDKLDADQNYKFSKLDQDMDIATRKDLTNQMRETSLNQRASDRNAVQLQKLYMDIGQSAAKEINTHNAQTYKDTVAARKNELDLADRRYEKALALYQNAQKIDQNGKPYASPDAQDLALREFNIAAQGRAEARQRYKDAAATPVQVVLPSSQGGIQPLDPMGGMLPQGPGILPPAGPIQYQPGGLPMYGKPSLSGPLAGIKASGKATRATPKKGRR